MTLTSRRRSIICAASGLLVAVLLQTSSAQDDNPFQARTFEGSSTQNAGRPRETNDSPYQIPTRKSALITPNAEWADRPATGPHRAPALASEFGKAIEALREAEGDEAKSKAEDRLRDLLTEYFGEDMKRREAELKQMEKRLKKLQEQLALRSEKMDEIVDLQMKVLVNQANGLGFFSNQTSRESQPTHNYYWYQSPRMTIAPQPPTTPATSGEPSPQQRPARAAPVAPPTERYAPPQSSTETAPLLIERERTAGPEAEQR
jgi:hypothetical protein